MKILMLILGLSLLSAALLARDLTSLARREKARRARVESTTLVRSFDDADLERYRVRSGGTERDVVRRFSSAGALETRNLEKERQHWREETVRHERELARLDAGIRKLEWRLTERRSRRKTGERLANDPTADMLADSLEALREQRRLLEERFRARARKAGAFPGWLR